VSLWRGEGEADPLSVFGHVLSLGKVGVSFTAVGRIVSVRQLFDIPQKNVCTEDTQVLQWVRRESHLQ
jgi:hypothetical protein